MPIWNFDTFARVIGNGNVIQPKINPNVSIAADKEHLYINNQSFPDGPGETGQILQCGATSLSWVDVPGVGATGIPGPTGPAGAPQGETGAQGTTGLGNFTQKTDFDDSTEVPEIMWNFQDESFYGFVTGVNKWVQISSGSAAGPTGLQGATGIKGTTGSQGVTGLQGTTGLRGLPGIMGSKGVTGVNGVGITGAQGETGPSTTKFYALMQSDFFQFIGPAPVTNVVPELQFTGIDNGTYILDCSLGYTGIGASVQGVTGSQSCYLQSEASYFYPLRISTCVTPTSFTSTLASSTAFRVYLKGMVTISDSYLAVKVGTSVTGVNGYVTPGSYATLTKVS